MLQLFKNPETTKRVIVLCLTKRKLFSNKIRTKLNESANIRKIPGTLDYHYNVIQLLDNIYIHYTSNVIEVT